MSRFRVRTVKATGSTNDDIRAAAEGGAAAGLVLCADEQLAGRGRLGRVWHSPPGNLYCSVLLRPGLARSAYGLFSFAASLAIADALEPFVTRLEAGPLQLKWPNDVLVKGAKISGILLEAGEGFLVIGMGVNLAHHPDGALYPTTSLAALGVQGGAGLRDAFLGSLLDRLGAWADRLENEGFGPLREAWLGRALRGSLSVETGGARVTGLFLDLDLSGRLVLGLSGGEQRLITSGDVFLEAPTDARPGRQATA